MADALGRTRVAHVVRVAALHPEQSVFTRFIPAGRPGEGEGTWRRYCERWKTLTIAHLGTGMVKLVPELRR